MPLLATAAFCTVVGKEAPEPAKLSETWAHLGRGQQQLGSSCLHSILSWNGHREGNPPIQSCSCCLHPHMNPALLQWTARAPVPSQPLKTAGNDVEQEGDGCLGVGGVGLLVWLLLHLTGSSRCKERKLSRGNRCFTPIFTRCRISDFLSLLSQTLVTHAFCYYPSQVWYPAISLGNFFCRGLFNTCIMKSQLPAPSLRFFVAPEIYGQVCLWCELS